MVVQAHLLDVNVEPFERSGNLQRRNERKERRVIG